ncbi:thioredoxin-like protein [Fimicolochytrium jonesii]|uniref:thioredoxin-like protein n=1 Tax=Fimicolochytrium jonesii TaxID=1396493 RepID=UPI0022FEED39|nr:thioredoxin-like protein [Fimicolochytrium jonesii]KAI8819302.1 thioredoxin-like protein [Fimicolochytrium jonesii]
MQGLCKIPSPSKEPQEAKDLLATIRNVALLDDNLETTGKTIAREEKEGRLIGLYFSAAWCPPCRQFSPRLSAFAADNRKDFPVVYCPLDRSVEQQNMNLADKGFLSLPFELQSTVQNIMQQVGVMGIPCLVVVKDGVQVTDSGRSAVAKNPDGAVAAWKQGKAGEGLHGHNFCDSGDIRRRRIDLKSDPRRRTSTLSSIK